MIDATLIRTNKDAEEIKLNSFAEAQKLVEGLIETHSIGNGKLMLMNEEAKLHNLPINSKATEILLKARPDLRIAGAIQGNVLIINEDELDTLPYGREEGDNS